MNTTDAEKLDGIEAAGIKSTNYKDDFIELDYGSLEWMKAPASGLIDYCRAVVERVGTSDPSVHQEGVNTSSDEAHGIKGGQTT